MTTARGYTHVQRGPVGWLCASIGLLLGAFALLPYEAEAPLQLLLGVPAIICLFLATTVHWLQVEVDSERVAVRFGPVSIFRRSIALTEIASVERSRSRLIDGWGIHFVPGRGWTWNLWGFDCVELSLRGGKKWRIGSDDADRLAATIAERIETPPREDPTPTDPATSHSS